MGKPTDINHLIREFMGFLGPKAMDAGVSIKLDLHDVPQSMLDPDAIGADALRATARRNTPERGAQVEMGSKEELERFEDLGKIKSEELSGVDFDELSRRLQG